MQDPHHVYLDLDVINNNYTQEGPRPYLWFGETRNTPFLEGDTSEYYCSIVRLSIQTWATPYRCLFPSIKLGQNDTIETIYKVSLRCVVSGTAVHCNYSNLLYPRRRNNCNTSPAYGSSKICRAHIIMYITIVIFIEFNQQCLRYFIQYAEGFNNKRVSF